MIEESTKKEIKNLLREFLSDGRDLSKQGVWDSNSLKQRLHDPKFHTTKGQFANLSYISEAKFSLGAKGFAKNGVGTPSNMTDVDTIIAQGRQFNKRYINEYLEEVIASIQRKDRKVAPFNYVVFTVTTQQFNWGSMKYGNQKDDKEKAFMNASEDDFNDFTMKDENFKKRIAAYIQNNPEMKDEIEQYINTNSFPRDIAQAIMSTHLKSGGAEYERDSNNEHIWHKVSRNDTGEKSLEGDYLRLTINNKFRPTYKHFLFKNGQVFQIPDEEFKWFAFKAFGTLSKADKVVTNLRNVITQIEEKYKFHDFDIDSLVKLSFNDSESETYYNEDLTIPHTDVPLNPRELDSFSMMENVIRNVVRKKINETINRRK